MKTCPKLHGPFPLFLFPHPFSVRQVGSSALHHTPPLHHRPERSRKGPVARTVPEPWGLGGLTLARRHRCPHRALAHAGVRSHPRPPRLSEVTSEAPGAGSMRVSRTSLAVVHTASDAVPPEGSEAHWSPPPGQRVPRWGWGGCSSAPESGFCSHLRSAPPTAAGAGAGARRPEQARGLLWGRGQPAQARMAPGLAATPGLGLSARGASASGVVSRPVPPRHGLGGSEQPGPGERRHRVGLGLPMVACPGAQAGRAHGQ